MFLQQFLDVLGLPIQDPNALWPEDPVTRWQDKAARLTRRLQQGHRALVRRRCRIERLRQRIERDEGRLQRLVTCLASRTVAAGHENEWYLLAPEEARRRLDRNRVTLYRHEGSYQQLLARVRKTKQKLGSLQDKIRSKRTASISLP